jgi:gluconolactonase
VKAWPLRVHGRLPEALWRTGGSTWAKNIRRPASIHSFLEGPVLIGDMIVVVDVAWGRIFAVDPSGHFELVLEYDGAPNGLAHLGDGELVIADARRGLVWAEGNTESGFSISRVKEDWNGGPFHGLNDLIATRGGGILATDQGSSGLHDPFGRVVHLTADGEELVVLDGLPSPNGLALVSDAELLVAMTRDNAIWRIPLTEQSEPFRVGRYIQLSGGIGPDGIAVTPDGWLLVAHLGLGVVWLFDPEGRQRGVFESPDGVATSNVTVDPERSVIFVTESQTGSVLVADMPKDR